MEWSKPLINQERQVGYDGVFQDFAGWRFVRSEPTFFGHGTSSRCHSWQGVCDRRTDVYSVAVLIEKKLTPSNTTLI